MTAYRDIGNELHRKKKRGGGGEIFVSKLGNEFSEEGKEREYIINIVKDSLTQPLPSREPVKVYTSKGFNMNYWKSYYPVESSMLNSAAGSENIDSLQSGAIGQSVSVPQSTSAQVKFCLNFFTTQSRICPSGSGITMTAGKQ